MRSAAGHGQKLFLSSRRPSNATSQSSLRGIHINISSDPFQHRIPPYIQRLWEESKLRKHLSVWKRRLIKRYHQSGWLESIILAGCVFSACLFLLIHVGFFSTEKYQEHYSDGLEEVDLLDKVYPDEGRALTTTIIILNNQGDLEGSVKPILAELCQYDMFANYIVWNDDPTIKIDTDMIYISQCTPNKLSVINAPAKMGSSARYQACRHSKTPYCYFQDIPGLDLKLRSTYANFLKSPHLIHGQSSSHTALINSQWRYCFTNKDLELHTCYIDVESGTFVAKAAVTSFVENYDKNSVMDEYADMYFVMFMNQIPYQLEGSGSYTKELTKLEIQQMDLGLTILYNDLEEEEGVAPINPHLTIELERNARAPCKDDRCLFLTNKQILPDIDLFLYTPSVDVDVSTEMHDDFYKNHYHKYKYVNAIDNDDQTSWKSTQNIHAEDYIGLDLLMPMRTSLKYRFLVRHPYAYRTTLAIEISFDGLRWLKLRSSQSFSCQNIEITEDLQLLECNFIVTDTGYRYIRLRSQKDLDFGFDVYDFSFSAKVKKDAQGQLLDITFDKDGVAFIEDDLF
ncbi:hypothetical protein HPULCUR_002106 [Helicostylum pulchrum]|uniref:F5/8 type C domain-containing protein n=1 Tax=Helicostylum pulchrum TaxID=562976 RepID=A0ABP9XPK6_9FUNG